MEDELMKVADQAIAQPGVTGYLCVDNDGLCVVAKGQACQSMSGIVHQIADLASKIEEPKNSQASGTDKQKDPPVVKVDLERYKMLIQSRDSYTTALVFNRN